MRRAHQLQPLSRQHHLGLNLARHAKSCSDEPQEVIAHQQALTAYMHDMHHHFEIEDNLITTGLQPYAQTDGSVGRILETLATQHHLLGAQLATMNAAALPNATLVRQFADLLYEHIRFEERELLPAVETHLTTSELDAIYHALPDAIKRLDEGR